VSEVLVEPEGLDWGDSVEALSEDSSVPTVWEPAEMEDPLLKLLRTGALLPKEQFLVELEKQRLEPVSRSHKYQNPLSYSRGAGKRSEVSDVTGHSSNPRGPYDALLFHKIAIPSTELFYCSC
jgi:hypothetical protein